MRISVSCWGDFRISDLSRPGAYVAVLAILCLGTALTGCSGPAGSGSMAGAEDHETSPVSRETVADWDDVEPAIRVALGQTELVLASVHRPSPGRIEARLRSSGDEPALLVITGPESAQADPVTMTLTCTVGRFGDPAREARVVALVIARLQSLKGVEFAPLGG